ncbi:MAG: GntR family transcriptional regulator [Lachnospiraceae bacterium]|nr:GntR family transcriptional regulator [Lachnospiraceae bacterium]
MDIIISNDSDKPIYEQITSQIKNQIMQGVLREGDALPSMRTLAKELRISVITTKRAYEELEREGFITTVVGKGSFIKAADTRLLREENLKRIEEHFQEAIRIASESGVTRQELEEIFAILYEG